MSDLKGAAEGTAEAPEDVPAKRRKVGRPLGSKTKPAAPAVAKVKLRDAIGGSFTDKDIAKLTPDQKARLLVALEPKARPEEATATNIRLIIRGMRGWVCESCGCKQSGEGGPGEELHVPVPIDGTVFPVLVTPDPGGRVPFPRTSPDTSRNHERNLAAPAERCADIPERTRPAPVFQEEAPLPAGVAVFRVPSIDDDGPEEWRQPIPFSPVDADRD